MQKAHFSILRTDLPCARGQSTHAQQVVGCTNEVGVHLHPRQTAHERAAVGMRRYPPPPEVPFWTTVWTLMVPPKRFCDNRIRQRLAHHQPIDRSAVRAYRPREQKRAFDFPLHRGLGMPWELVTDDDGEPLLTSILVVHAGLLPTGEVLLFGGGEHSYARFQDPDPPPDVHGHVESDDWDGERACWVYNHWQRRWVRVRDLAFGAIADEPDHQEGGARWYPTLITLPSGALIAFGGHPCVQVVSA